MPGLPKRQNLGLCRVSDCPNKAYAHEWCKVCYQYWLRRGRPSTIPSKAQRYVRARTHHE